MDVIIEILCFYWNGQMMNNQPGLYLWNYTDFNSESRYFEDRLLAVLAKIHSFSLQAYFISARIFCPKSNAEGYSTLCE